MEDKKSETRESDFGTRFLEKAIQASIRLPSIGDHRETFVESVLRGRSIEANLTDEQKTRIDEQATETRKAGSDDPTKPPPEPEIVSDESEPFKAAAEEVNRRERILARSANTELAQDAISLRLLPLAPFLPGNPRDIKRIVNTISMYQDVLELTRGAQPGSPEWEKLCIGVVLSMAFPTAWESLREDPTLLPNLLSGNEDRQSETRNATLVSLAKMEGLLPLLKEARFGDATKGPLANADDIEELRDILI